MLCQQRTSGSDSTIGDINSQREKDVVGSTNFQNYLQWRYMNTFNRIMPFLERTLEMRNGGNQFFMGDQMNWCDMMCYCCLENPYTENQSMFSSYPKLMALRTRVAAHPKIAGYLKSRCNTNW